MQRERDSEMVSLEEAADITGLPREVVAALATCRRIPSEQCLNGRVYVNRVALIGWCKLYGRILQYVANYESPHEQIYSSYSPFELVWMSRHGMLDCGRDECVRA